MNNNLEQELAVLDGADTRTLRAQWHKLYGREAPRRASSVLLRLAIAYGLQEQAHGTLAPKTKAKLKRLGEALDEGRTPPALARPRIRPGTAITKEWRGEKHTVVVLPDGYLYREATYKSLSEIAREITGTRWNGPAFFGLRKNRKAAVHA